MIITDIFIKRPVLATVVSLMILVLGLRSIFSLPVRQFPFTQNAVIKITTYYTGADPALIAGFITTPLETSVAQANGIDYLTSQSIQGLSTILANLRLNYDPDKALTEITTKVNAVLNLLPKESQLPTLSITIGESIDSMYIGFYSEVLAPNQVTDYLTRVVQPRLQSLEGVQLAEILGAENLAMRAWLNPLKMAAYAVTSNDVANALANNDFISAAGRTDGNMIAINLVAGTGLSTVKEFEDLIVKAQNGAIIRLKDVAKVELGSDSYDFKVSFDGKQAVYIGIQVAPAANLLTVIDRVRAEFPSIQEQLPQGIQGKIVYDASKYVYSAIHEVVRSLIEAVVIVTLVIFLFLGSIRSVLIPVIAIPLSLIGTFFMMLILGYSINLLTLLALVLAIGLVVDDAIIVVENVHRHMEAGMPRFKAAIIGARELANPIIAISIVLIAVYLPIGFMGGLTGALFTEFAFTLAGAVGVSAIVALTLSPMMCSQFLEISNQQNSNKRGLIYFIDRQFEKLSHGYQRLLHNTLNFLPVTLIFCVVIIGSIYFFYINSKTELAPQEDQGIILALSTTSPNASLRQTMLYSRELFKIFNSFPETDHIFQLDGYQGLNTSIGGMVMKPWDERKRTTNDMQWDIQLMVDQITGAKIGVFQPAPLPGTSGLPVQFVITTMASFEALDEVSERIMDEARASHLFTFIDKDLKIDKAQVTINFDRDKTALMGLTMADLGNILSWNLSQNYVNFFDLFDRSYKVIPQVHRRDRLNANQVLDYYITASNGSSIPLGTVASLTTQVVPETINHFQQQNSTTISAMLSPGVTLGQGLDFFNQAAKELLPSGFRTDYAQQSRQFVQESGALIVTFFFAIIIIYLTLGALFESFRDPLIVLISVPMSISGAMLFISLGIGGASLNIYTQVGLVTLIGLISKHGILIVQFANDLQLEGKDKRESIEMASRIRLRPILMTTASMVLGVVPLVIASGAGAVSRFNIGLVIMSGISIGTLFTLFVVPAMYMLLGEKVEKEKTDEELGIADLGTFSP